MSLHLAQTADLPAIADLVNTAYRGGGAQQGWTTEAGYIDGARTSVAMLSEDLAAQPDARLMVWRDDPQGPVLGCVWLEPAEDQVWYLGMLTVSPSLQSRQLGRRLLAASEEACVRMGARRVRMTVVNIRDTLIAWYLRRGYALTGPTRPSPMTAPASARPAGTICTSWCWKKL